MLFISVVLGVSLAAAHAPSEAVVEMKNSPRTGVRQYNKSELPRLRWTPELHEHFIEAVESLGGKDSEFF